LYGRDTAYGLGSASDRGYVTDIAWGYRALSVLDYSDVFAVVNLQLTNSCSHDVDGYSPAPESLQLEIAGQERSVYTL